ncbi:bis(5'-adenosyl)-triphosphatase enpp4-like, partial [Asbolus verrucosus]
MFHYNENIIPIWRRNEDMGNGRYTGVMMWPGGYFPYQGKNVTYFKSYDPDFDWYQRIDTEQLNVNQLTEKVHVIHLSDHGMVNVKPSNFINVTQYLIPNTYVYAGTTPVLQLFPNRGFENDVYQKLKNASKQNGHFKIYKKDEYLDRWHYKNNPRSPPILVMADVGYGLDDLIIAASSYYPEKFHFNVTNQSEFGVHGYDYTEKEMRPFFMARGPKIKVNHKVAPFNTVDLFNLFCEILEITPTKNNGSVANIVDVLKSGNGKYSLSSILVITAGGIFIALILIGCAAVITLMMIKRQQSITTTAALNKRFPQTFQTSIEAQHLLEPEDA